jgi:hypothetical protein
MSGLGGWEKLQSHVMRVQKCSRFPEERDELNLRNIEGQMFPPLLVKNGASEGGGLRRKERHGLRSGEWTRPEWRVGHWEA